MREYEIETCHPVTGDNILLRFRAAWVDESVDDYPRAGLEIEGLVALDVDDQPVPVEDWMDDRIQRFFSL